MGYLHAADYDFNNPHGYFTVKYPDGGYRGPLEVGEDVILYCPPEDPDEDEDGFGIVVTITRVERSKHDPDWLLIYTDYPERTWRKP